MHRARCCCTTTARQRRHEETVRGGSGLAAGVPERLRQNEISDVLFSTRFQHPTSRGRTRSCGLIGRCRRVLDDREPLAVSPRRSRGLGCQRRKNCATEIFFGHVFEAGPSGHRV